MVLVEKQQASVARFPQLGGRTEQEALGFIQRVLEVIRFEDLESIPGASHRYRRFTGGGMDVALKLAGENASMVAAHGGDVEQYSRFMKVFHHAVEEGVVSPKRYEMVDLRVYGTVETLRGETFIVMERVAQKSYQDYEKQFNDSSDRFFDDYQSAKEEIACDVMKVAAIYNLTPPDVRHAFSFGHTNPEDLERGRWRFTLPLDVT